LGDVEFGAGDSTVVVQLNDDLRVSLDRL
jgi:hypothetical protein